VYVDGLAREHGSLAAVAARLCELRGFRENAESIERALRRLRARGSLSGGQWGARVLGAFGLPTSVDARLRFMGSYHSRFVDLPVPLCADLVQLWDRPPTSESRAGRLWLSLARATIALRSCDDAEAREHLATARAVATDDDAGLVEVLLGEAHDAPEADRLARLEAVRGPLARLEARGASEDVDCLRARWVGQRGHALTRSGRVEEAEALHVALPDTPRTAAFARSRRANGIAYARHRQGDREGAIEHAWLAVRYAGDAGHVRLRAMALLMVARVARGAESDDARERARGIARALGDETLLARCEASARGGRR
jgi:hypothetical protein